MTMMTYDEQVSARSDNDQPDDVIDTRTLWTGGVVTAVIVGGLTIVGFLLIEGILRYPLLGDRANAPVAHVTLIGHAASAAVAALLATAVMHILLVTTHRPQWFLPGLVVSARPSRFSYPLVSICQLRWLPQRSTSAWG